MENKPSLKTYRYKRMFVSICVLLPIAAAHIFRVGTYFNGKLFILYYSYFSDIVIPIGIYFLLCINDVSVPSMKNFKTKSAIVFVSAAAIETAQGFGIPLLGSTFDPLDFVMFGVGIIIAVCLDKLFSYTFSFGSFGDMNEPTGS